MKPERKPPVIRRGQKKPFVKATLKQQEERIEWLAKQYAANPAMGKYEAHRIMAKRYNLHWRTIDEIYIVRAKKLLQTRARINSEQVKDLVVNVLLEEVNKMKGAAKVSALRLLGDIFGIVVSKHQIGGLTDAPPIKTKEEPNPLAGVPVDRLKEIAGWSE